MPTMAQMSLKIPPWLSPMSPRTIVFSIHPVPATLLLRVSLLLLEEEDVDVVFGTKQLFLLWSRNPLSIVVVPASLFNPCAIPTQPRPGPTLWSELMDVCSRF